MLGIKGNIAKYMEKIWTLYVKCTTIGPTVFNSGAVLWGYSWDFLIYTHAQICRAIPVICGRLLS